jgi:hypothetical protein
MLRRASNPVVAVKTGMVLAGIARFGRLFITSLTDDWKIFVHRSNTLDCCCSGKFDAFVENGAVHAEPIQGDVGRIVVNLGVRYFNGWFEFSFKNIYPVRL